MSILSPQGRPDLTVGIGVLTLLCGDQRLGAVTISLKYAHKISIRNAVMRVNPSERPLLLFSDHILWLGLVF